MYVRAEGNGRRVDIDLQCTRDSSCAAVLGRASAPAIRTSALLPEPVELVAAPDVIASTAGATISAGHTRGSLRECSAQSGIPTAQVPASADPARDGTTPRTRPTP